MRVVEQTSGRRWLRRTNVYIAEYIVMLMLVTSFIGVLCMLWFSFFDMLYGASYFGAVGVASQIGSLIVIGPAAFWMYARVTGQEMIQPELYNRASRTVFLSIWIVFAVLALVGLATIISTSVVSSLFVASGGYLGHIVVTLVLPGLFSLATGLLGVCMIVKRTSRKMAMRVGQILALLTGLLLIANLAMVMVRKDAMTDQSWAPSISPSVQPEDCALSGYPMDRCGYGDYRRNSSAPNSSPWYYDR